MRYPYTKLTGSTYNVIRKISIALGISMEDVWITGDSHYDYIDFGEVELTTEQVAILDNIMANSPCSRPVESGKTTYKVPDLYRMREWFYAQWGIEPVIWFDDSEISPTGEYFTYLHFPRVLTSNEKNQIISVYNKAIREVV